MTEENYRKWDIIMKALSPLAILIGIGWGIYQYHHNNEMLLEKEYTHQKEILIENKDKLYKETVQVVSFLAMGSYGDSSVYKSRSGRFWELYWGDLASVESSEIESLMVQFGRSFNAYPATNDASEKQDILNNMKNLSLQIAHTTKQEIESDYNKLNSIKK